MRRVISPPSVREAIVAVGAGSGTRTNVAAASVTVTFTSAIVTASVISATPSVPGAAIVRTIPVATVVRNGSFAGAEIGVQRGDGCSKPADSALIRLSCKREISKRVSGLRAEGVQVKDRLGFMRLGGGRERRECGRQKGGRECGRQNVWACSASEPGNAWRLATIIKPRQVRGAEVG